MTRPINRREFIAASVTAGLSFGGSPVRAAESTGAQSSGAPLVFQTKPHKALIARPTEDDLKRLKDAGFDGVEGRSSVTPEEAAKMRLAAAKLGLRIHSVLIDNWGQFNSPDPAVVERSFAES